MDNKKGSVSHVLHTRYHFKYKLVVEGILCGAFAGMIAIMYRILLSSCEQFLSFLSIYIKEHVFAFIQWFVVLILLGLLVSWLLKKEPLIGGSGIPQVEGEMLSFLDQKWYTILLYKIIGGCASAFAGLSLGREGPSIQLGAMAGKGISRIFHRIRMEEKLLLTCGAAAGLSAAFNAPLAGVMFALEEIHRNFSPSVLICVMCSSITGDFLSRNVFGLGPVFHFAIEKTLPLHMYGWILILGILMGILGVVYNAATLKVQDIYEKFSFVKPCYRILFPFLLSGILLYFVPVVLGGGHFMIELLSERTLSLSILFGLLMIKFIFSLCCFGSGAPGGIFFPLLVLGSYAGAIFATFFIQYAGMDSTFLSNFIILGMAGFFAAIVRAPITGIILIAEMSGTLQQLLPLVAVSFVSYIVADACRSKPIYESLLERLLIKNGVNLDSFHGEKHLEEFAIELNSFACEKKVSEISWPKHCLLVSICRKEKELIPRGDTNLYTGDILVVLMDDEDTPYIRHQFKKICSNEK